MATRQTVTLSAMTLAASISAGHAGPCAADIDAMQGRIDAKVEAMAAAGPTGREGTMAGMSVQPTPRSIATAEAKLGEISPQTITAVREAMTRARVADATGDNAACEKALTEVQRLVNP